MVVGIAAFVLWTLANVNPLRLFFNPIDISPSHSITVPGTHRGACIEIFIVSDHLANVGRGGRIVATLARLEPDMCLWRVQRKPRAVDLWAIRTCRECAAWDGRGMVRAGASVRIAGYAGSARINSEEAGIVGVSTGPADA